MTVVFEAKAVVFKMAINSANDRSASARLSI